MESWTIKKMLQWSADYLSEKGIESGRLHSEILLAHVLELRRLDLYLQFDRPLSGENLAIYKDLIKRRINHEPVAYMVGQKEFWSMDFFVTESVLIPRPDTETVIQAVFDHFDAVAKDQVCRGLEVGLGSGILSIVLLSHYPQLKMVAVETSADAVVVAKKNAEYHGVSDRLTIIEEDYLNLSTLSRQTLDEASPFDVIVSNPPYIRTDVIPTLESDVKDHEPALALDGGEDGLTFYNALFQEQSLLSESGVMALEIGEDQKEDVSQMFRSVQSERNLSCLQDMAGHDRVMVIR